MDSLLKLVRPGVLEYVQCPDFKIILNDELFLEVFYKDQPLPGSRCSTLDTALSLVIQKVELLRDMGMLGGEKT